MALTKITNSLVAVNAIQGTLIADNAITAVHIQQNQVNTTQIAINAVTATIIQDGVIARAHLAADLVDSTKIADDAISEEHLDVTVISSLSTVTANSSDYVMIGDSSDSNNLKKALVSDFGNDLDAAVTINDSGADVDFRVESNNDANKLFVDGGTDNVGIGTGAPVADLDILGGAGGHEGNLKFTEVAGDVSTTRISIMPYDTDNSTINFDSYLNDAENAWVSSDAGSNFQLKKTGDKFAINYDSGVAVDSTITWNTAMIFDTSGKVGIGTTDPDAELEIEMASNNSPELRLTSATVWTKLIADDTTGHSDLDFSHTLRIKEAGTEVARIAAGKVGVGIAAVVDMGGKFNVGERSGGTADINIGIDANNRSMLTYTGGMFTIGTRVSSTNYFDTLVIKNGKVGIGTDAPNALLTVGSTSTSGTELQILSTTSGNGYLYFGDGTSGASRYAGYIGYYHNGDYMTFNPGATERMRVQSTGLGIGIAPAKAALYVSDGAMVLDNLYGSGNMTTNPALNTYTAWLGTGTVGGMTSLIVVVPPMTGNPQSGNLGYGSWSAECIISGYNSMNYHASITGYVNGAIYGVAVNELTDGGSTTSTSVGLSSGTIQGMTFTFSMSSAFTHPTAFFRFNKGGDVTTGAQHQANDITMTWAS